jgi:hypothetical protein
MAKAGRLHPTIHAIGKFAFDIGGEIERAQRDFDYTPVVSLESTPKAFVEAIAPALEAPLVVQQFSQRAG